MFFNSSRLNRNTLVAIVVILPILAACSSEAVKRSTYEALHQKQCMDDAKTPNCDPEHKSYDQYKKDREETLKSESGQYR